MTTTSQKIFDSRKLKYICLPGKLPPNSSHVTLQNEVYDLWKKTWSQIFEDVGNAKSFVPDDFYRQDIIPIILYEGEIVAFHLYTFFNTNQKAVLDHRYFSIFDGETLDLLCSKSRSYFMSMEFLTVSPDWRKSQTGVSFAAILSSLGLEVLRAVGASAAIAPARKENKINSLAYSFGATCLKSDVQRGNLVCDLIAVMLEDIQSCTESNEREIVEQLWNKKEVYTYLLKPELLNPSENNQSNMKVA